MARFSEVDQSLLPDYKYLGWGVDCRKSEEEQQQNLMTYGGPQIRALQVRGDGQNVVKLEHEEVVKTNDSRTSQISGNRTSQISGIVKDIFCELSIELGGKNKDTDHEYVERSICDTVTLKDDIRNDPDLVRVKYDGSDKLHSKYEEVLSAYVLDYVKDIQRKARANQAAVESLGKPVEKLRGKNAIAKLQDLTREGTNELQKSLVEACTKFVDKKCPYTHYVYSIKRGRMKTLKKKKELGETHGEVAGKVAKAVTVGAKASYSGRKSKKHENELGKESPEVLEMNLKPLYTLVKSEQLRHTIETQLKRFDEIKQGTLSGPFTISCQPKEGEKVYWCILDGEVNGTTDATCASQLYIKYLQFNPPQFGILYSSSDKDELFVRFTQTERSSQRLQVVDTATVPDITFQLQNSLQEYIDLPKDKAGLVEQRRFFLQKCGREGWLPWLARLTGYSKPPYVAMVERKRHHYEAKSCEKIDQERARSMLFQLNYTRTETLSPTKSPSKRKRTATHPVSGGPSKRARVSTSPDSCRLCKQKTISTRPASGGPSKRKTISKGLLR